MCLNSMQWTSRAVEWNGVGMERDVIFFDMKWSGMVWKLSSGNCVDWDRMKWRGTRLRTSIIQSLP